MITVIECSEDANICLSAYKACKEPGEVSYIRKGHIDKIKKVEAVVAQPGAAIKTAKKIKVLR